MTVQPGLCETWSETPKTGFLKTRLIFKTTLMLFLVIFEEDKSDTYVITLEEINPLEVKKHQLHQNQNKLHGAKVSITSLKDVKKKRGHSNNKLIYLLLKIQEIFQSRLANFVNKFCAWALTCLSDLQLSLEIFPVFLTKG